MNTRKKRILAAFSAIIIIGGTFGIYSYIQNNRKVIKGDFPDPFEFNNGTRVETMEDWQVRRQEIKEMMMEFQYGYIPDHPDQIHIIRESSHTRGDGSVYSNITIILTPEIEQTTKNFSFSLDLYYPGGQGPFPTIVKVSPDGEGSQVKNNQTITSKGYMYACFHHKDLDPDATYGNQTDIKGEAQSAYPTYDWGSLGVWAWGAMRVADVLLNESWVSLDEGGESFSLPEVKEEALIVTGHSRRGKTALVAGAFDERFDMVCCNGGCAGGAASYLVLGPGAETLEAITAKDRYHYWFQEDFGEYANKEKELPFDQHFMRALVAPRVMLTTDGIDDLWANPLGVQAVYEAAQPVFDFLNVPKKNGIHFRSGGHGFKEEDFSVLLNFAGRHLLGDESIHDDFYMTPFNETFPIPYEEP